MSDSENEFGGFGGTTPDTRKAPRSANATAGPSKAMTNGKRKQVHSESEDVVVVNGPKQGAPTAKRKRNAVVQEDEDDARASSSRRTANGRQQAVEEDEDSDDVQEIAPSPTKKPRAGSKKPSRKVPGNTSGTERGTTPVPTTAAAKGKAKAKTTAKVSPSKAPPEEVVELMTSEDEADAQEAATIELAETITQAHRAKKASTKASRKESIEITRLTEDLEHATKHISDLKKQLEDLHKIRVTEAELILERLQEQHAAEQEASRRLIDDLERQIQRMDPLLRTNKRLPFEILTREDADKETQTLRDQVTKYKEVVRERDQTLKERDAENQELQARNRDLQSELQLEIERSKQLAAKAIQRAPNSAQRTLPGRTAASSDNPHIRELTKFYEDLTNVVVLDVKAQTSEYSQAEDWVLRCLYSYQDVVNPDSHPKTLAFNLRLCKDPKSGLSGPPSSEKDLVDSAHFQPLNLDKESPEFVTSLGFLNTTFTFERTQLSLFSRTLHDVLSGENKEQEESEE